MGFPFVPNQFFKKSIHIFFSCFKGWESVTQGHTELAYRNRTELRFQTLTHTFMINQFSTNMVYNWMGKGEGVPIVAQRVMSLIMPPSSISLLPPPIPPLATNEFGVFWFGRRGRFCSFFFFFLDATSTEITSYLSFSVWNLFHLGWCPQSPAMSQMARFPSFLIQQYSSVCICMSMSVSVCLCVRVCVWHFPIHCINRI